MKMARPSAAAGSSLRTTAASTFCSFNAWALPHIRGLDERQLDPGALGGDFTLQGGEKFPPHVVHRNSSDPKRLSIGENPGLCSPSKRMPPEKGRRARNDSKRGDDPRRDKSAAHGKSPNPDPLTSSTTRQYGGASAA